MLIGGVAGVIAAALNSLLTWLIGSYKAFACAFALLGYWFRDKDWYRPAIAIPGSVLIALIGAYWFTERIGIV